MGSPQSYWDKSAREMGLIDSEYGIMLSDNGAMMMRRMDEMPPVGGTVPLPALTNAPYDDAKGWEESAVMSPEESQEKSSQPCEADASILLMLKNPEGGSPKSVDGVADDEVGPVLEGAPVLDEAALAAQEAAAAVEEGIASLEATVVEEVPAVKEELSVVTDV